MRGTQAEAAENPHHEFDRVANVDGPDVARVLEPYRPSAVVHLAADSPVEHAIDGPGEFIRPDVVDMFALRA